MCKIYQILTFHLEKKSQFQIMLKYVNYFEGGFFFLVLKVITFSLQTIYIAPYLHVLKDL